MTICFKVITKSVCNQLRLTRLMSSSSAALPKPDLATIRQQLEQFDGGSVDMNIDEDCGIAVITLNNPRRLNSLTGKMMVDMSDHVAKLENWSSGKGLILLGTNNAFCSGGDLTFVRKALDYGGIMATFQHHVLTRMMNLPLISVALLQGHCLGGGAELATACDFRVMSSAAKIGFVQIKVGITTGWGATTRLVQQFGRQKALKFLTSGQIFTAEEALKEGLVDHTLPYSVESEAEFDLCKKWLVSNHCKYNADLIQAYKKSVVFCDYNKGDTETSLRYEGHIFEQFWGGPAHRATLEANLKHRV